MTTILVILIAIGVGGLLFAAGYSLRLLMSRRALGGAEQKAKEALENAARDAETIIRKGELDAKEFLNTLRKEFEGETRDRRNELSQLEKRLHQREEVLDRKLDVLDRKEKELNERTRQAAAREQTLKNKEDHLTQLIAEENEKLKSVSGLTSEQAKQLLLSRIDQECRSEAGMVIKRMEEETKKDAQTAARKILVESMQRCAAEFSVESTTSAVPLPNDEMKGRIIGREGRNIKAFELATGVDLIVDDTPDVVTLSSFDLMRREIAKASLERLMADGRIHPARIEEVVEKVKREFDQIVQQEGEKTLAELNLHGMHAELVKLLGRLRYRTSYGQNCLLHLKESAFICGMIAAELGLDQRLAKRCALMHDVGKAVSHEVEGPHALIGAELA
ncbi:MAG: ribonuclease Y, partial [Candidatus Omnitrophica bacterium]|nr:ribonuclease Y [Candidatus Omnitrophota bacterium]